MMISYGILMDFRGIATPKKKGHWVIDLHFGV
jgi:hypothetical protein